jgi:hypothetical protein
MACHGETLGFLRRMEFMEGTTCLSDSGYRMYIITVRRITSGELLK